MRTPPDRRSQPGGELGIRSEAPAWSSASTCRSVGKASGSGSAVGRKKPPRSRSSLAASRPLRTWPVNQIPTVSRSGTPSGRHPGSVRFDTPGQGPARRTWPSGYFLRPSIPGLLCIGHRFVLWVACGGDRDRSFHSGAAGLAGKRSVDVQTQVAAMRVRRTRRVLVENPPVHLHTLVGRQCRGGEQPWQCRPNPVVHGVPRFRMSDMALF
jgi:hypothetical protein